MEQLRIQLLGRVQVSLGDRLINLSGCAKAEQLFCYLALHRRQAFSREYLAALLWGDQPEQQARRSLRTILWRLRMLLAHGRGTESAYLTTEQNEIFFNTGSAYWLDVEEFEKCVMLKSPFSSASDSSQTLSGTIQTLAQSLALYRGELMEGCYQDWCLVERERLHTLFLDALIQLMRHNQERGELREAIQCAQMILKHDPLLEEVQRELIGLLYSAGNRVAAVRQYHQCRSILQTELGIAPMAETVALYQKIAQAGSALTAAVAATQEGPLVPTHGTRKSVPDTNTVELVTTKIEQALAHLHLVQVELHSLSESLKQGTQEFEALRDRQKVNRR